MSYQLRRSYYTNKYPAIEDLAIKAKSRIPHVSWEYLESGTGDENLLFRNRNDFSELQYHPQFCKGHLKPSLLTTLFQQEYALPFGVAPVGLTGLIWPRAEILLAQTAQKNNIPFTLSTVATETPEEVGRYIGEQGWFQLYPPKDKSIRDSLLQRARKSGFHTLVITADVPMAGRRERSKRAGLQMPPKITPRLIWQGLTHPYWTFETLKRGLPRLRTVEHYTQQNDFKFVSGFVGNRLGGTLDWEYCRQLKEAWDGPVIIKGILHPEDAKKAVECGMDGIWVSNHGGRQFNGAISAIKALPELKNAIQDKAAILFDSGVRSGLDIMRALSLGADFVMLGRPFLYGVSALGRYGGDHVVELLRDDLINNMVQLGVENMEELKTLMPHSAW